MTLKSNGIHPYHIHRVEALRSDKDVIIVYLKDVIRLSCVVCKEPRSNNHSSHLFESQALFVDGVYYYVPTYGRHKICRELFIANPLAYIDS